jgi:hypothetical protein
MITIAETIGNSMCYLIKSDMELDQFYPVVPIIRKHFYHQNFKTPSVTKPNQNKPPILTL